MEERKKRKEKRLCKKTKSEKMESAAVWRFSYRTGVYVGTERSELGCHTLHTANKYKVNGKSKFFVRFYRVPT